MINFVHSNDISVMENLLIAMSKRQMQSNLKKFIITGKVDGDIIEQIKRKTKIDIVHLSNELNICENLFLFLSELKWMIDDVFLSLTLTIPTDKSKLLMFSK